jgi:hypothetical protein
VACHALKIDDTPGKQAKTLSAFQVSKTYYLNSPAFAVQLGWQ